MCARFLLNLHLVLCWLSETWIMTLLHEDCVMLSLMLRILIAYWPVYESAGRILIHKMWCTCCDNNSVELNDSCARIISQSNVGLLADMFFYITQVAFPLVCTSGMHKPQRSRGSWKSEYFPWPPQHPVRLPCHIFLVVNLCDCASVLTCLFQCLL